MANLYMYDDVNVSLIPTNALDIGVYIDGRYKNIGEVRTKFPRARLVTIATSASDDADALDVEAGDATIEQAKEWLARQLKRGVYKPVIYISAGNADSLVATLTAAGFKRDQYRLWTAHYGFGAHLCGPNSCGLVRSTTADWTQFTDTADNRSLDESLLSDEPVFTAPSAGTPKPGPEYPVPSELAEDASETVKLTWKGEGPHWRYQVRDAAGKVILSGVVTTPSVSVILPGPGDYAWCVQAAGNSPFTEWKPFKA